MNGLFSLYIRPQTEWSVQKQSAQKEEVLQTNFESDLFGLNASFFLKGTAVKVPCSKPSSAFNSLQDTNNNVEPVSPRLANWRESTPFLSEGRVGEGSSTCNLNANIYTVYPQEIYFKQLWYFLSLKRRTKCKHNKEMCPLCHRPIRMDAFNLTIYYYATLSVIFNLDRLFPDLTNRYLHVLPVVVSLKDPREMWHCEKCLLFSDTFGKFPPQRWSSKQCFHSEASYHIKMLCKHGCFIMDEGQERLGANFV